MTPDLSLIDASAPDELAVVRLSGLWNLRALSGNEESVRKRLQALSQMGALHWCLDDVATLDSFGATLLWHAWGGRWPEQLSIQTQLRDVIERVAACSEVSLPQPAAFTVIAGIESLGGVVLGLFAHIGEFIRLLGQLFYDFAYLLCNPHEWPLREISATMFKAGLKALPVTALVGFLIGVVLSYLSALQLKMFGADIYIVNILGLGIIRELGPVLVSVLVAGRSGSAMTAQLGVMRVTEEMDALEAMGVSRTQRLVFPKVVALALIMPLLVVWMCVLALFGGMVSAWIQLDLSMGYFIQALPAAVSLPNLYIALTKGLFFGILIALVSCYFGLRVRPNTESLAANTTASVVSGITLVILADALIAIATRSIGVG